MLCFNVYALPGVRAHVTVWSAATDITGSCALVKGNADHRSEA